MSRPPWTVEDGRHDPVLVTAIHAGTELRDELATMVRLPEDERFREEDPFTDRWTGIAAGSVSVHRSRFEIDLNRPRDRAVYRRPEDAWGLEVWSSDLPDGVMARSLDLHDAFYRQLGRICDELVEAHGRFVVLDLHSYNHRRSGPSGPVADPAANPEINLGTESIHQPGWDPLLEAFADALRAVPVAGPHAEQRHLDVRSNVRFRGGNMVRWLNARYGSQCCAIAVEVKKVFMDEWTGRLDEPCADAIGRVLDAGAAAARQALA